MVPVQGIFSLVVSLKIDIASSRQDSYSCWSWYGSWLLWWHRRYRIHLQCRRPGFDPWFRKIPCRRKFLPIPVFLPGKSHGQRSLAGLQSVRSQRVRHDWAANTSLQTSNLVSFFFFKEESKKSGQTSKCHLNKQNVPCQSHSFITLWSITCVPHSVFSS